MRALIALAFVAAVAFTGSAQAQSFDCAKASSRVERMICASPDLGKLDVSLAARFRAATTGPDAAQVRKAQVEWFKRREACDAEPCVRQAFEDRIAVLNARADQPVAQPVAATAPAAGPQKLRWVTSATRGVPCEAVDVAEFSALAMQADDRMVRVRFLGMQALHCSDTSPACRPATSPLMGEPLRVPPSWHTGCVLTFAFIQNTGYEGFLHVEAVASAGRQILALVY